MTTNKTKTVTKAHLVNRLSDKLGLNKHESKEFIEGFFSEIVGTLESGVSVKLSGFGNFVLRDKNERPGRNPKTGKVVPISARRVVVFRPGQKLKNRVAGCVGQGAEDDPLSADTG